MNKRIKWKDNVSMSFSEMTRNEYNDLKGFNLLTNNRGDEKLYVVTTVDDVGEADIKAYDEKTFFRVFDLI